MVKRAECQDRNEKKNMEKRTRNCENTKIYHEGRLIKLRVPH